MIPIDLLGLLASPSELSRALARDEISNLLRDMHETELESMETHCKDLVIEERARRLWEDQVTEQELDENKPDLFEKERQRFLDHLICIRSKEPSKGPRLTGVQCARLLFALEDEIYSIEELLDACVNLADWEVVQEVRKTVIHLLPRVDTLDPLMGRFLDIISTSA